MSVTRRSFGKMIAATAVVVSAPALASRAVEYGWCYHRDDYFNTGFTSRADAVAEASAIMAAGRKFETAEIEYAVMKIPPDCGEAAAIWMVDGGTPLGNAMASWLVSANEDDDYEGEFDDGCFRVSRESLGDTGRIAIGAALRRIGEIDLASAVESAAELGIFLPDNADTDAIYEKISNDMALERELQAAIESWAKDHDLASDLHGLTVSDRREHMA